MPRQLTFLTLIALLLTGCTRTPRPDPAQPVPGVRTFDTTLHSAILHRDMPLRIALPEHVSANTKLPVVFLLHGYAANYSSFSAWCPGDTLALGGFILVMPEDPSGFFLNQRSADAHYEDYLLRELLPAVPSLVPQAATDASHRAIVGNSRAGLGAILIALRHPELFSFAGGLNSAFDIPTRPFLWNEFRESLSTQQALGPRGSATRHANDPFALIASTSPASAPFLYLNWSSNDDLAPVNQRFANELANRGFPHSATTTPGDHDWSSTAKMLPSLESSLIEHFGAVKQ